ncbi:hypothetical protein H1R17_10050 [Flavobacterium sp. xlx-214]|uniref:phosphoribosyltransferase-like protein n=1 Tax=unclassified Flavobacterium TaxID=196869 RepID=UPI0013D63DFE|nr:MULTISPECIES: hypothetical protein [unclassified Flavobacterium]MBA5791555.1 hypothetical protein [Flavobacterium sp. xlx-221]QMI82806.1 hypothetical protein H1R17_10050 [Flavobacterium sp. xlx-214]
MKNDFVYNENSVRQIEYLVPRLKYSVLPTKIVKWLENFDDEDRIHAMDILQVFEYVPFAEFMYRLDSHLKELLRLIPINDKIIIIPFGKVGKSGTLVTYPLRNTKAYKSRESQICLTHDLQNIEDPFTYKHIIFLDDFIGSGNTFLTEFTLPAIQNFIMANNIQSLFILSVIIMTEGKQKIESRYPTIKIFADERHKVFNKTHSPFVAFEKDTLIKMQNFNTKYGKNIPADYKKSIYLPHLGYDNSESLVSFFHGTPNNTLPIIYGHHHWTPLFPRSAAVRMKDAIKLKKEIAYSIGICTRLNINIYNRNILSILSPDELAVLFLKGKGYENIFLCQILGLSREELLNIYLVLLRKKCIEKNYITLTNKAILILKKLKKEYFKERIRNENETNLLIKNTLYLPQLFNGNT